ncbi:hypothetical protein ACFQ08_02455 [Streptosporangium algeriense]|uniref:Ribbon-helix-helix protein CopG domain-containing protein n=1 Tax=Streptosporangium algeriense TaxID=1682748 RepID=A0ABW3DHP7_9ACTN
MATATEVDPVVQFGGRIPSSLRRRVRMAAVAQDKDAQDVLREALEQYLERHNF